MLELRFVEIVGSKESVQPINKFPVTIGKSMSFPPPPPYHIYARIDNQALSNFHCLIEHEIDSNTWAVTDGTRGKASTNGVWFRPMGASEMERVNYCVMGGLGDQVYLISTKDGRQVYLEVHDPAVQPSLDPASDTATLEPEIVKVREEIQSGFKQLYAANDRRDVKLENLESALKSAEHGGMLLIGAARYWKELLIGTIVVGAIATTIGTFAFTWLYYERAFDLILPPKVETRNRIR